MVRTLIAATLLLSFALAVTVAAYSYSADTVPAIAVQGDANCDRKVGPDDAFAVLLQSAGISQSSGCIQFADVNCDDAFTADDVVRILRYLTGFPPPHIDNCLDTGQRYDLTPSPTPVLSAPPGATLTPTPTSPPPTYTPTPNQTPRFSGEPNCQVFPADNPWNTDISGAPVDANSNNYVNFVGRSTHLHPDVGTVWNGAPIGIPYAIVGGNQPKVPITYYYSDSDPGPYPIPPNVPVEGQPVGAPNTDNFGGDRHVIVIDETACKLYETFDSRPVNGGQSWDTGSAAIFDLNSNALRPDTWTSADAAGLPIFPGLIRYSEVQSGVIDHALRFTVHDTQHAFIHPATHEASATTDPNAPPMGLRFRMKASYDCNWASSEVKVICAALKKYGMFVADNGADWYISGAPDNRWSDDHLGDLKSITGDAFEVVQAGPIIVPPPGN